MAATRPRKRQRTAGSAASPAASTSSPSWKVARSFLRAQLSGYSFGETATIGGVNAAAIRSGDEFANEAPKGLESQERALFELLNGAADRGENQSVLLVGPHGCGKSLVLNRVLEQVRNTPPTSGSAAGGAGGGAGAGASGGSDGNGAIPRFLHVNLDGSVLQDDVQALLEISRQLCLTAPTAATSTAMSTAVTTVADDEADDGTDGAASLLSTSTVGGTPLIPLGRVGRHTRRGSFRKHMSFVTDALREGRIANVPVFLVLDNFEAFADRSKQTLLYNLLDLTQKARYGTWGCGVRGAFRHVRSHHLSPSFVSQRPSGCHWCHLPH